MNAIATLPAFAVRAVVLNFSCPSGLAATLSAVLAGAGTGAAAWVEVSPVEGAAVLDVLVVSVEPAGWRALNA